MQTGEATIQTLFEGERQFRIPLYQRHYDWGVQWRPLWEDIVAKCQKCESASQKRVKHFTGAIVIQLQKPLPGNLVAYDVIDGQQRLTTFQIILCAFRDVCRDVAANAADNAEDFAEMQGEAARYLINTSRAARKQENGIYKLVPTKFDREAMSRLVRCDGEASDNAPSGKILDAYQYFHGQIKTFVGNDANTAERLLTTIRENFGFVQILIDSDDEPEIIFESLNYRGKPLGEFDLLRNYLFLRTRQSGDEDRDVLYKQYWEHFETDRRWNNLVTVAKQKMPLSELFLQHFLTAQLGTEKVTPLFQTYREEYSRQLPDGHQTRDELRVLHEYSQKYLSLVGDDSDEGRAMQIYRRLDITSLRPFFLYLLAETELSGKMREHVFHALQSYSVRRLLCTKHGNRNFNKFFPELIKKLRSGGGFSGKNLLGLLKMQESDTRKWPKDRDVRNAFGGQWHNRNVVRYFLYRVECQLRTENPRTENDTLNFSGLTLEHFLPQSWEETWPLPSDDGKVFLRDIYAEDYKERNPKWWDDIPNEGFKDASYIHARQRAMDRYDALHNIGNLNLLTPSLNASASNASFEEKKQKIEKHSRLFISRDFSRAESWDVEQIRKREEWLYGIFCQMWPNAEWFLDKIPDDD